MPFFLTEQEQQKRMHQKYYRRAMTHHVREVRPTIVGRSFLFHFRSLDFPVTVVSLDRHNVVTLRAGEGQITISLPYHPSWFSPL